ncbi:hypothetical protein [Lysobacter gummosus]
MDEVECEKDVQTRIAPPQVSVRLAAPWPCAVPPRGPTVCGR